MGNTAPMKRRLENVHLAEDSPAEDKAKSVPMLRRGQQPPQPRLSAPFGICDAHPSSSSEAGPSSSTDPDLRGQRARIGINDEPGRQRVSTTWLVAEDFDD